MSWALRFTLPQAPISDPRYIPAVSNLVRLPRPLDLRVELGLSARVANLLARRDIRTVAHLLDQTWEDIDAVRGIGFLGAAEIDDVLIAKGFWLERRRADRPPVHAVTDDERVEPIEHLGLSAETLATLTAGRVSTVGDLTTRTLADLLRIERVGSVMADEVRVALRGRGLALAEYVRGRPGPKAVKGDPMTTTEALYLEGYIGLRAMRCLDAAGCKTVGDVAERQAAELLGKGFGTLTVAGIREAIHRMGFALKGESRKRRR